MKFTIGTVLLIIGVALFIWCGLLYNDVDLPGNPAVLSMFGLASAFASFLPWGVRSFGERRNRDRDL